MATKSKKQKHIQATGRRKNSSARARIHKGKSPTLVNNIPATQYFPGSVNASVLEQPFKLTETQGKYYATVKVVGGGIKGQLEAATHAIAKALNNLNTEKFRPVLKKAGLLTRD